MQKEEYVLDLYTHKCEKHTLDDSFHRIGVEHGAESDGEVFIGGETSGTGVHVSLWEGNYTDGRKPKFHFHLISRNYSKTLA